MIYADTNAVTRCYVEMPGSTQARALLGKLKEPAAERLPITWLLELEFTNAIELAIYVSRTSGQMRVTPEGAAAAQAMFIDDIRDGKWMAAAVLPVDMLKVEFTALSLRHSARFGFRTYDILHVASALLLGCDTFWSFDGKARALARLEGLQINEL